MRFATNSIIIVASALLLHPLAAYADDFTDALTYAYINHPTIQAGREELNAVDEGVPQALSGFMPNARIDYNRGYNRSKFDQEGQRRVGNLDNTALVINQPLFNGGQSISRYNAAIANTGAERAQLHLTEQQILLEAIGAYTDVVEKQTVLDLSRDNTKALRGQVKAAEARFQENDVTRTDVSQARSRLAAGEADEQEAEGALAIARSNYKRAVGLEVVDTPALPPFPHDLPKNIEEVKEFAANNPNVLASEMNEKAADAVVSEQKGKLLPQVNLQGIARRNYDGQDVPTLNNYHEQSLTLNISIPLYQSGAEYSRVREAKNRYQKAHFQNLDAEQEAIKNAQQAWQDYLTALALNRSYEEVIIQAEIALSDVSEEKNAGTRTTLDVLDAQQELFRALVNKIRAERRACIRSYQLMASIGRLNPETLGLNVASYDPNVHYKKTRYKPIGF